MSEGPGAGWGEQGAEIEALSSSLSPPNPFPVLRQAPPPLAVVSYFLGWRRIWLEVCLERIISVFQGSSRPRLPWVSGRPMGGRVWAFRYVSRTRWMQFSHLIQVTPYILGLIIPILQVKKLRFREVK